MKYKLLFLVVILLLLPLYYQSKKTGMISETGEQIYHESSLTFRLSTSILTSITGNRTSFIAFVNNTGTAKVDSVRILMEGIPLDWINILPLASDISPAETKEYLVTINVPKDAQTGIYKLRVKARDEVESETRNLTLIIGKDPKEVVDLLSIEVDRVKAMTEESLLIKDCIEISLIQASYNDANIAYQNGIREYENASYFNAISWFEYALPVYEQVVDRVDITVASEISTIRTLKLITPLGFSSKNQLNLAESYLSEKNYEKICDPVVKIRNLIMIGIVFWSTIIILVIISIIIFFILRRKRREIEREKTIERVRERLEISNEEQT